VENPSLSISHAHFYASSLSLDRRKFRNKYLTNNNNLAKYFALRLQIVRINLQVAGQNLDLRGDFGVKNQLTGTTIREHRQRLGIRQAELARRVGISASYFNQIEHNRRRINGKLLSDIATALGVDLAVLAEGADTRLTEMLRDAQASEPGLGGDYELPEVFSGRFPAWARLLVARHRRVQTLQHLAEALTDRLAHDSQLGDALHELLSTVTAIRSSASILVDEPKLEPVWRDRFQRNIIEDSARLSRGAQGLVDYLDVADATATGAALPREELEQFLDENAHHFPTLETEGAEAIDQIIASADRLNSPLSRDMARVHLRAGAKDAAKIPLRPLQEAIARHGLTPPEIARTVGADLATTLRRLASLPAEMLPSPVGLLVCDASGTVTWRKQVEGFSLPRYSGACPLLPLFLSLTQPLRPMRRMLQQSGRDRDTILTYTIATPADETGLEEELALRAHMLIIPQRKSPDDKAPQEAAVQVGQTCRICMVAKCRARREPSILARGGEG